MFVAGGGVIPWVVRELAGIVTTWGGRAAKDPRGVRKFNDWEGEGVGEGPGEEREGSGPDPGRFGGWDGYREGLAMVVGCWFAKELLLPLLTGGCPGYTCVSPGGWARGERLLRTFVAL